MMLTGHEVRKARASAGWSQKQLGDRLSISQASVSKAERSRDPLPPALELRIRHHLRKFLEPLSTNTTEASWSPPQDQPSLPVRMLHWTRSRPSGDSFWITTLPGDSLFVAALDIAGHGAEAADQAIYARAWLLGWLQAFPVVPQIEACAGALRKCLAGAEIDASWFIALFMKRGRSIDYIADAYGFPGPLLMYDDRNVTRASIAEPGSPPIRHAPLQPQWKIIMASDGLLERLGDGDSIEGKRHLSRWQVGPNRRFLDDKLFDASGPGPDDETLLLIDWDGWDLDFPIELGRDTDLKKLWVLLQQYLEVTWKIRAERAMVIENGVLEAIENARLHGYPPHDPGRLWLRARHESSHVRLQIEDAGRGMNPSPEASATSSGFDYLRNTAAHFDHWHRDAGGTTVSLLYAI